MFCLIALSVSKSTFYRSLKPKVVAVNIERRPPPKNRIPDLVRSEIRDILHEPRFVDRTPWEIVPTLMDEGIYLASIRSFYRILNDWGESLERRRQAIHVKRSPPILEATGPNQVWTWDITRIPGPFKGQFFFLYVMIDIFSRYVVGWMLAERENARRAQIFIRETASKHLTSGQKVKVHNDRGSPMKAGSTQELFDLLGLEQSFSRPRTSDDNPFSESQFKTLKYANSYPMFVDSLEAGERYLDSWFNWYNYEHQHKGLNLHTPAGVQFKNVDEVITKRQYLMDMAYANNPERFPKGRPLIKANPSVVGINLRFKQGTTVTLEPEVAFSSSTPVHESPV